MKLVTRYFIPLAIVILLMQFGGQPVEAQRTNKENVRLDQAESLKGMIRQLMKAGEVTGLSIVVIKNGKADWQAGFGVKNVETNDPIDSDTVFETASLTKPVLAYAVMKLIDGGKLDLDKPLETYVPGYLPV